MNVRHAARVIGTFASVIAPCALAFSSAARASPYVRMAPLEQYLMSSDSEIALARSAAPVAISDKATVLVLKPQGYETAVTGSNGFTCLVERAWMSPFDSPEFWNPQMRGPVCYNPAASQSVLEYTLRRSKLAVAGHSKEQMLEEIRTALKHNELPSPAAGAMSYMMSKDGTIGDGLNHWHPHLMFHIPKAAAATWGANVQGSPVIVDDREVPEPQTVFLLTVAHWSDGTAAAIK
jgi:hypothetical protein